MCAAVATVLSTEGENMMIFASAGVAAVFGVFQIFEDVGLSVSDYHPPALSRIQTIAEQVKWDRVETLFNVFVEAWRFAYQQSKTMQKPVNYMLSEAELMAATELDRGKNLPPGLKAILEQIQAQTFNPLASSDISVGFVRGWDRG